MSSIAPSPDRRAAHEAARLAKRLRHAVGQAIADYNLIEEGDRVMVCLSGGKDSWTLLDLLLSLQQKAPVRFELVAVNLDQKQPGFPARVIPDYCRKLGIAFHVIEQDTYSVVTRVLPEGATLCSLCSRLRRGALYAFAEREGFTRIALGHHRDDILATFFLNLFYGGTLKAMPPKLVSDNGRHVLIRPLAYCREADIAEFAEARGFPIIPCNLCGSQENLKRRQVRRMLDAWEREQPGRSDTMFRALAHIAPSHLADPGLFDFAAFGARPGAVRVDAHAWLDGRDRGPVGASLPATVACGQAHAHRSPFTLHPSPFTLHRSPFTLHPPPFTVHRSPFTLHPSPFTLSRSPMFFRNLTLFRFSAAAGRSLADLEAALASHALRACGPLEVATRGFVPPFGPDSEVLSHTVGKATLVTLGSEEKLLPASVVNAELGRRLKREAEQRGRPLGSHQRRALKAEIMDSLLPRAFVRPGRLDAYLDARNGWLVLDTASRKAAEAALTALREALGSFPAQPLAATEAPHGLMTRWLTHGQLPSGLALGDECELRDPARGAVIRCRRQELESTEIRTHLKQGKQVFRLGLQFEDRMGFVLGEDLVIRKLRFLDVVQDSLDADGQESPEAALDARFVLMTLELERLFEGLEEWFGLERPSEGSRKAA